MVNGPLAESQLPKVDYMEFLPAQEDLIHIGVSILCGSLIGFEREYRNKSAGFRTIVLICLGSTIFTIVSKYGVGSDDRIAANIITGIGFIGAGVIFKDKFSVMGLTTAAVIWTAAGIGMAAGIGYYGLAIGLSIATIIILSLFSRVELLFEAWHLTRTLYIGFQDTDLTRLDEITALLDDHRIQYKRKSISKQNHKLSVVLELSSNRKRLRAFNNAMVALASVEEFYYNS